MPEEHVTDIERDLAALLAVDPSPAFAAGVCARTASARPSRVRPAWMWAAAAAALVLAVVVFDITLRDRRPDVELASSGPTPRMVPPAIAPRETPSARPAPTRRPLTEVRPVRVAAERVWVNTDGPEVIVDPAFREAVVRMAREAAQPPMGMTIPATASALSETLPADLDVVPMTVGDLTVPEIRVSVAQPGAQR